MLKHNSYETYQNLYSAWRDAIAHVGAKQADLEFNIQATFDNSDKPLVTVKHNGYMTDGLTVVARGDIYHVMAIAVFRVINEMCDWYQDVLANPEHYDADQIDTAKALNLAYHKYELVVAFISRTSVDNLTINGMSA